MSLYEYQESREIDRSGFSFYALIMGAIREADTVNLSLLRMAFPGVVAEFAKRRDAPGGLLPSEVAIRQQQDAEALKADDVSDNA